MGALTSQSASSLVGNLVVTQFNGGVNASASTYWRGDATWANPFASALSSLQISANAVPEAPPANSLLTFTGNDATGFQVELFGYGGPTIIRSSRAQGTKAVPTAVALNSQMTLISNRGYDGAAFQNCGGLTALATETWTAAQRGMQWRFQGTPSGSIVTADWFTMNAGNSGRIVSYLPFQANVMLYVPGVADLLTTIGALTNYSAAAAATLLNAPIAGDPSKWLRFDDAGTPRYIPCW